MRKLGLIGGMGPESTIPYYHDIVYGVQRRLGTEHIPRLTIESVDVCEVVRLCEKCRYDELTDLLMDAINNLIACGADFAAMAANTPHIVYERLKEKAQIPIISIVETAKDETLRKGFKRVGLLGTIFTMKGDFFKKVFTENGIEIVVPEENEMEIVSNRIYSELEKGILKKDTLDDLVGIIRRMKKENEIEAIVLGCTELPLMINDEVSPVPCIDTMKIHVNALIDKIIE